VATGRRQAVTEALADLGAALADDMAVHGDLPPGHTYDPVKLTVERTPDGRVHVHLTWREVRNDLSSALWESSWTLPDRSPVFPRHSAA
jgi:hypothetical protein